MNNKLIKYKKNPIRKLFDRIVNKVRNKFYYSKMLDQYIEEMINSEFTNEIEQKEVKELLEEILTRNKNLLETLDIRMLNKDIVNLFGKAKLERMVTDEFFQRNILELSKEQMQFYAYILNYNLVDFNERAGDLSIYSCKNIKLEDLQNLDEKDRLKAISIILSEGSFNINDISELNEYYEKRRKICQEIIDNPNIANEEYDKELEDENEISEIPFELLFEMHDLSDLDKIRYAICEAKYGMSLEKAKALYRAFGRDIDKIAQSEEARVIKELIAILEEDNIEKLKEVNLEENYANYEGTINIVPNLRNAYLKKYKETLYQVNEEDYIETQSIKTKGKKTDVKIYNVLGKNNDKADFNMIVTSLGGIYCYNHNYDDLKSDWDRADKNHTISCSYIGNDFLGVVDENYLLGFSDIRENELLQARNQDAGTVESTFCNWSNLNKCEFLTPKNQINSSKIYNELFIERKLEKDGKLINRIPTFAVFIAETIDDIYDNKNDRWKETKRMSAELGIPIAVIDGTQCARLEFEKVQEMIKTVKEERRMDLIPQIIHKIENNRATQIGVLKKMRNEIFSETNVKKILEEIMGTIITSDINNFNKGIEEFTKVTKEIKNCYQELIETTEEHPSEQSNSYIERCKTYDYDKYLDRLKVLFSYRNGLNTNNDKSLDYREKEINCDIEQNSEGIDL